MFGSSQQSEHCYFISISVTYFVICLLFTLILLFFLPQAIVRLILIHLFSNSAIAWLIKRFNQRNIKKKKTKIGIFMYLLKSCHTVSIAFLSVSNWSFWSFVPLPILSWIWFCFKVSELAYRSFAERLWMKILVKFFIKHSRWSNINFWCV